MPAKYHRAPAAKNIHLDANHYLICKRGQWLLFKRIVVATSSDEPGRDD